MSEEGSIHWVDLHVGGRIRLLRKARGLSQERLALELGITFQQVQKYEKGTNRVAASRLYQISRVLDVPYEELLPRQPSDREVPVVAPIERDTLLAQAGELVRLATSVRNAAKRVLA